ncbi:uncharacterized protein LOC143289885 [Babylonia areolata]|uniref:uncharacterized protein LOC143289885 n=1 Tax=Babylonia areolata TaxID=304850 RepID=UPI003FD42520
MSTTKHVETAVDGSREIEVFVFHNPRKRKTEDKNETKVSEPSQSKMKAPSLKKLQSEVQTLDLETARKNVRNLGISGLIGRTKIEAKMAQLKSLGAEIPKNWERKMEKKRRNEEFQRRRQDIKAGIKTKQTGAVSKSASKAEPEKKKKKKEDVFFDGQIGKYKDGVQYLSAADIQRVRSSKGKRK